MRRVSLNFLVALVLQKTVFAQGIGSFPGDNQSQNINFVAISNAPSSNLPSGTVSFYSLTFSPDTGYSTNLLIVDINVGSAPNTDGWIVQQENDGSLTPVIQLSVGPYYTGLGSLPAGYADSISVELSDIQLQSFFSGQLYAETDFGSDSYLGQLLPVPEPTAATVFFVVGGLLFLIRRLRR